VGDVYLCRSNVTVCVSDRIALRSSMTVDSELERMLKEVIVA
jgi:hypothetical protein